MKISQDDTSPGSTILGKDYPFAGTRREAWFKLEGWPSDQMSCLFFFLAPISFGSFEYWHFVHLAKRGLPFYPSILFCCLLLRRTWSTVRRDWKNETLVSLLNMWSGKRRGLVQRLQIEGVYSPEDLCLHKPAWHSHWRDDCQRNPGFLCKMSRGWMQIRWAWA